VEDGGETDLDLGNYERFLDINLTHEHSITAGKIYKDVIDKERRGDFLGKTVQVVPHITNHIMEKLIKVAKIPVDGEEGPPDFCMIELGGTIGDIESAPFVEALRQLKLRPLVKMCHVHLSLVPVTGDEQKTKPTQHGVQTLRSLGLVPDIIACRCEQELAKSTKTKIALHCNLRASHVISLHNVADLWHVPVVMNMQHVAARVASCMEMYLSHGKPKLREWGKMVKGLDSYTDECTIAIVGKYTGLEDAYLSVLKALKHGAYAAQVS
jgi:CTP synthase